MQGASRDLDDVVKAIRLLLATKYAKHGIRSSFTSTAPLDGSSSHFGTFHIEIEQKVYTAASKSA